MSKRSAELKSHTQRSHERRDRVAKKLYTYLKKAGLEVDKMKMPPWGKRL